LGWRVGSGERLGARGDARESGCQLVGGVVNFHQDIFIMLEQGMGGFLWWVKYYLTLVFVVIVLSVGHYASVQGFNKTVFWIQILQLIVMASGMLGNAVWGTSKSKGRWALLAWALMGLMAVLMMVGIGFIVVYAPRTVIGGGGELAVGVGRWLAKLM